MPGNKIPDDWDEIGWLPVIVDWPCSDQWIAILNGLVSSPVRGRFWDKDTGTIIDAQDVGELILERNFTIGDGMANLTERLIDAIDNLCSCGFGGGSGPSGCSGVGGAGTSEASPEDYIDDPVAAVPPAGYDTYSEYQTAKCNIAQTILDQWEGDIRVIENIQIAILTFSGFAAAIGVALLTPIPFDDFVVLAITVIGIIVATGSAAAAADEAADYVAAIDICDLYCACSALGLQMQLKSDVDAHNWTIDLAADIVKSFMSIDALNPLFGPKPAVAPASTGSCGSCSCASCSIIKELGTGTAVYPNWDMSSADLPGAGFDPSDVRLRLSTTCLNHRVTVDNVTETGTAISNSDLVYTDTNGTLQIVNDWHDLTTPWTFDIMSGSEFSFISAAKVQTFDIDGDMAEI